MRILLTALHGILTGQTDPSWPDRLDAWMFERDANLKVLKKEYHAGPFPRWNCWIKDRLLARSLVNEIELFFTHSGKDGFPPRIWFIAHSNGAVIALLTAGTLIDRGHRIDGLILTGGACEADIDRNGVLEWQCRGMLGAAIAYCSKDDNLLNTDTAGHPGSDNLPAKIFRRLWGKAIWPYGCLGRTGWLLQGRPLAPRSRTRTNQDRNTCSLAGFPAATAPISNHRTLRRRSSRFIGILRMRSFKGAFYRCHKRHAGRISDPAKRPSS